MEPAFRDENSETLTYMVKINNHLYEMSADADKPNGVCIYLEENEQWTAKDPVHYVPYGMVKAIANIAVQLSKALEK